MTKGYWELISYENLEDSRGRGQYLLTPPFRVEHNQEAEDRRKAKQGMMFAKIILLIIFFSRADLVISKLDPVNRNLDRTGPKLLKNNNINSYISLL